MTSPRLTLAYVPGATPAKWLRVWAERHPETPMDAERVPLEEVRARLDDGRADAALLRLPSEVDPTSVEELHVIRLYEETQVAVLPRDHAFADFGELSGEEFAELSGEVLDPVALGEKYGESGPLGDEQLIEVVASGAGIAVMPQPVARLYSRRDVRAVVLTDARATAMALVWRRDSSSPLIEDLAGIVRGRGAKSSRGSADGESAPPAAKSTSASAGGRSGGSGARRQQTRGTSAQGSTGSRRPPRPKRKRGR
ncbi:LysR substrate-binding domain-containing protein [Ruicaihuangia caeni]|uniref:LysR substrate-binding domain-containing protein n=1 Tax=Ruicaihuangia caeni TaxID=3042517 RepID=A0AAW6T3W2_9MICO|nr:LysR substrate-binding domain-containing protein [Klugiella sp. YN-L-19]MDI2098511.1 LysR substrate-binding domain-containing protein [Klugiella sp. YN-L-19]